MAVLEKQQEMGPPQQRLVFSPPKTRTRAAVFRRSLRGLGLGVRGLSLPAGADNLVQCPQRARFPLRPAPTARC